MEVVNDRLFTVILVCFALGMLFCGAIYSLSDSFTTPFGERFVRVSTEQEEVVENFSVVGRVCRNCDFLYDDDTFDDVPAKCFEEVDWRSC